MRQQGSCFAELAGVLLQHRLTMYKIILHVAMYAVTYLKQTPTMPCSFQSYNLQDEVL